MSSPTQSAGSPVSEIGTASSEPQGSGQEADVLTTDSRTLATAEAEVLAAAEQPVRLYAVTPEKFRSRIAEPHPTLDTKVIREALDFATTAHEGQKRESGEPYINHPVAVASILMDLKMDTATICAGLMHDVLEDCSVTREEMERKFGSTISNLVEGVTKISKLNFETREQFQAENLRKMLLAMTSDVRVILVKLADRLHNLSTLKFTSPEKQKRVARETMEVFTPLAHRLGIYKIKWEMEDLCLRYTDPKIYFELIKKVAKKRGERDAFVKKLMSDVENVLAKQGIKARVTGRPKSFFSIYKKTIKRSRDLAEVYDLLGIRIITESIKDCYAALGVIHETWKPIPNRFKDYIAVPKTNLYQSLHTTVIHPDDQVFEVQIRTREMDEIAEDGIAAHWSYKAGDEARNPKLMQEKLAWLRQILEWHQEVSDTGEFVENVKLDLFQSQVYVFTPQGRVIELPAGATPLDFAYTIHTEVGHRCVGAQVNGKMVPLTYQLRNGQILTVLTSKQSKGPSRDWLDVVKSSRAKSKIRAWLKRENRDEFITRGRESLTDEFKKRSRGIEDKVPGPASYMRSPEFEEVMKKYNFKELTSFMLAVGQGDVSAIAVINSLPWFSREIQEEKDLPALIGPTPPASRAGTKGVLVSGMGDMMTRLSKCCSPVIGDPIVGYITRGRGVSVHRRDCPNLIGFDTQAERQVEVAWDIQENEGKDTTYLVEIEVRAADRPNVLLKVTKVISDFKLNIHSASARVNRHDQGILNFTVEIRSKSQLDLLLTQVRDLPEVNQAYRVQPQKKPGARAQN